MIKLPLTAKCAIFSLFMFMLFRQFSNQNAELPSTDGFKLK
ncbi:hypothetical protein T07_4072 [Trichinella nelsoni]|uniref:Uncharacterized protein n=1 Tax=Trichinella nelsoni TaxID=6336 RepID=A0A0V0RB88_9BILA|nr:hypothetical protein T07_4072 [Trichinella nelsoni]